ncbi:MAG: hypothetical protein H6Q51_1470 [Deltaproteobacteria bacterium]|nr:hypothetical protein [Deltaproteobacteria bacterium]
MRVSVAGDEQRESGQLITKGGVAMADYYINIFLDEEKLKRLEGVGLANRVQDIAGRKAVQVGDVISNAKTLEVMKVAIMKLYNPLAGKALRSKMA